jgi:S-disulfanyl-L-cysteine oxidoreductase SoxD
MFNWRELCATAALLLATTTTLAQGTGYPGIGRPATPKELAAWDIDVRPDFKGLPKGSGSVARGQQVWESQCASCHGIFGESGEVFNPIVGGTTAADIASGHVARLKDSAYPGRTTLMKTSTVSTLWDYINRAMPWTAPKSLSTDDVYAVTAYVLNLGGVVPDNFVMSDKNIAEVQKRLPNRNGMSTRHALWPGKELGGAPRPDVQGSSCMAGCAVEPKVVSQLPDFARNAHGNLADQNRSVGPQRGVNTASATAPGKTTPAKAEPSPAGQAALGLAQRHTCTACHGVTNRIVGPAFQEIARKHASRPDALAYLGAKIRSGGSGVWGAIPMPEQTLPEEDLKAIAQWLATGANP